MDTALDYNGTFPYNGGTINVGGSVGMACCPSDESSGCTISIGTSGSGEVTLKDASGTVIASYQSTKSFSSVFFSSQSIQKWVTYTAYQNGEEIGSITVPDHTSSINVSESQDVFFPGSGRPSGTGGERKCICLFA